MSSIGSEPTSTAAAGPAAAGRSLIEVYGHGDCGLCRTAMAALRRLRGELGFDLVEHDIAADAALHRAYFERVPVIVVDGVELFDFAVDEPVLRRVLAGGAAP